MVFHLRPVRPVKNAGITANRIFRSSNASRSFHATPSTHFDVESVIAPVHSVLDGVHATTGLPWAAVIPLTAVLVRSCVGLPLAIYARKRLQRQYDLLPLLQGWRQQIQAAAAREKQHLGPIAASREANKALRSKRRELFKRWDCQTWKPFMPGLALFVWLPVMETIRNMSGVRAGLIGLVLRKSGEPATSASAAAAHVDNGSAGGSLSYTPLDSTSVVEGIDYTTTANSVASNTGAPVVNTFLEPGFATEGALWFPDLSVSDPTLLLPFMLSASMFLNTLPSRGRDPTQVNASGRRITLILRIMALAAGPLTLQMPSAMLLYWTTSMTLGFLQNLALDAFMPMRRPIMPCNPEAVKAPGSRRGHLPAK